MKLISVSILLICLIAATFSKGLLIACYQLNEKYVAQQLCINKNNANSHCNGHCYLSRQLNNDERPATPINNAAQEKFEIQLFIVENNGISGSYSLLATACHATEQQFREQDFVNTFFRPPSV